MGLSGQSLPGQAGPELLPWDARSEPGLLSKQGLAQFFDRVLCRAVRHLDSELRRRQGIFEFTDDPQCILRLSVHRAESDQRLSDQRVRRGEWIGEMHLWNEHILPMTQGGATMVWGNAMRRRLRRSLTSLAAFAESDERFAGIKAFRGEAAFGPGKDLDRTRCLTAGFGFEINARERNSDWQGRLEGLGQTLFLWGMIHTFNRGALRSVERLAHPTWVQLWMPRETLRRRYGPAPGTGEARARAFERTVLAKI